MERIRTKFVACMTGLVFSFVALLVGRLSGTEFLGTLPVIVGGYYALDHIEKRAKLKAGQG